MLLSGPAITAMRALAKELGVYLIAPIALQAYTTRPLNNAAVVYCAPHFPAAAACSAFFCSKKLLSVAAMRAKYTSIPTRVPSLPDGA